MISTRVVPASLFTCMYGVANVGRSPVAPNAVCKVSMRRNGIAPYALKSMVRVCPNSGEDYVDYHVTDELLRSAENPASVGTQVDIRRYACW